MAEFQFPNTSEPGYQDTKCLSVYLCINIQQTEQDKECFRLQLLNELQWYDFIFSDRKSFTIPCAANKWKTNDSKRLEACCNIYRAAHID